MATNVLLWLQRLWRNRWFNWTLRLCVAVGLLMLAVSQVDMGSVLAILQQTDLVAFSLLVLMWFGILYVQSFQTALGIKPLGLSVDLGAMFQAYLGSMFYNLFLPASAVGGIVWYKIGRPGGKLIEAGLLLFFFRLLQTILVLGIGLLGVWFDTGLRQTPMGWMSGLLLLIGLFVALPFVSPRATQAMHHLATPFLHLPPPNLIRHQVQRVWQAVQVFQQLPHATLLGVIGLSLLMHSIGIWRVGLAAQAVGVQQSLLVLAWTYILVYIISLIPISVAGLGVRDVTIVMLLSRYGVPEAQALSMSLLLFSALVVIGLVGGLVEAWTFWRYSRQPLLESQHVSNNTSETTAER
jgi:hypothetical protein